MSAASYYRLNSKVSCAFFEASSYILNGLIINSENNRQNNYASNPFSFRTKKTPSGFLRKLSKSASISHPRTMTLKKKL